MRILIYSLISIGVVEGDIIGTSGTCNISSNLGNHLHLEISNNGEMVDPESIFNKTIEEL